VYLERNGFDFYENTLSAIIKYTFAQEIVKDLEIINKEQLTQQLENFITTNNLPPATVVIILGPTVLFEKDIPKNPSEATTAQEKPKDDWEIQKYLDTIPFEHVSSKTYLLDNGTHVIATNRDLYDYIIHAFENHGSVIETVIPAFILGEKSGNGLNDELIGVVLDNIASIKQDSLIIHQEQAIHAIDTSEKQFLSLKPTHKREFILIGVFGILFIIFAIFYYLQSKTASSPPTPVIPSVKQASFSLPNTLPTSSVAASVPTSTSAAILNKNTIKIQLVVGSNTTTQGQLLKNKLQENGFTNIAVNQSAGSITPQTLIVFSNTLDPSARDQITTIVKNIFTSFSTQQNTQPQFDITIIIGNTL